MPLKTLVKVGNITNLSDARYCAGMGVEMLGFSVVEGDDNFINAKAFQEIRGWVTGPAVVAEVYQLEPEKLAAVITDYAPDYLELSLTDTNLLSQDISVPFIVSVNEHEYAAFDQLDEGVKRKISYLVINQAMSTSAFINDLAKAFSILLKPMEDAAVTDLLKELNLTGIVLNGSKELKPGLKDYDHLAEILEQLDAD